MKQKATSSVDREIGARIRLRRTQSGFSQEKLADALGLTFQQVQKYEKGMNRISASRLLAIANIFGVPVSFFLDGLVDQKPPSSATSEIETFLGSKDGLELARAFVKIESPEMRRALVDMARAAANF